MSDENVRLALRVHDEVKFLVTGSSVPSDPIDSVTEVTCSDLIYARVVHT